VNVKILGWVSLAIQRLVRMIARTEECVSQESVYASPHTLALDVNTCGAQEIALVMAIASMGNANAQAFGVEMDAQFRCTQMRWCILS